ncbi:hypothetical protein [Streptomyces sp. PSAA01]|uniref:hypothetical protein n=1 Tax=Streptomyces sp. PSAA01 TaxID=2912762 RepID=UPI001F1C3D91|nr:hypothetical protein [Streptomyces sp. PSAA01]MCG0285484.1 hypothetical protein [Streptomyces sp. PSAA01]
MEPRGYRMVVSTELNYVKACGIVERQLLGWIRGKGYDPSGLDEGRTEIAPHATLDHDSEGGRKGAYSRWRMRETPSATSGTWQSTLIVRSGLEEDGGRTWVQVDIEHQPAREGDVPKRANTPNIVRSLLDALEARDALADVTAAPVFIEAEDVDDAIEELCDSNRRMPVVIATVPYGKVPTTGRGRWSNRSSAIYTVLPCCTCSPRKHRPSSTRHWSTTACSEVASAPTCRGSTRPGNPTHNVTPVMSRRTIEADPRRAASVLAALPQRLSSRQSLPAALLSIPRQRTRPRSTPAGTDVVQLRSDNAALTALLDEAERAEATRVDEINGLYAELAKGDQSSNELRGENEELYDKVQEAQRLIRFLPEQLQVA